jgi:dTMP kinase
MKRRGKFICITGIDGSGKTTISKLLIKELQNDGILYCYVYNRYKPILLKPFMYFGRSLFLRNENMFKDYKRDSSSKKRLFRSSLLKSMYLSILLIDYSLQIFLKVNIPIFMGDDIICDRYLYDTVFTDICIDLNYSKDDARHLLNKCFRVFLKPDITFFIDVPENIAFNRKDDIPSIDYLIERKKFYKNLAEEYKFIIIEGDNSIERIMNNIKIQILGI